jgi:geranylgeranyl diphosphate synthase type II
MTSVTDYLQKKQELVNSFLESYVSGSFEPARLHESVKYSLLAGGKRIRPILCLTAHEACGGDGNAIMPQACAVELIHTYSLIHDDLPSMDNDELRRGKPTNHVVFGEAMAILSGDALLTDAFRIFSENAMVRPEKLLNGIQELASAAGIFGMVAGQAQDIMSENAEPDSELIEFIHLNKTAALIKASVRIGALLSDADEETIYLITDYGSNIGLAFQVIDDILDIVSSTEELGKPSGSDEEKSKMTYPTVHGIERSLEIARENIESAITSVQKIKGNPELLIAIAEYLLTRTH